MIQITKEFIRTHKFESIGIIFTEEPEKKYFRPSANAKLPPSDIEHHINLRKKLSAIFSAKYQNYDQLEARCYINESLMRKYLNGTRPVKRPALAKFCVGTKLTVEQSAELFTLQGHSLEPETQLLDAIIVNAIQDGDDIEIFFDTCEEYGIKIS